MSTHKPAQFTPGPWAVEPRQWDHGASLAIVAPHNGYIVAVVPFDEDIQTVDEPDYETVKRHPDEVPNANLIAAAPAMYGELSVSTNLLCRALPYLPDAVAKELVKQRQINMQVLSQAEGRQT